MSEILTNWLDGKGLPDVLVIDGHTHVGEWPHAATFNDTEEGAAEAVVFMDANGIDLCCAQSGGYMWQGTDYRLGNDFLLELCAKIPDRMVGFMHVNPNDTRANILAELIGAPS